MHGTHQDADALHRRAAAVGRRVGDHLRVDRTVGALQPQPVAAVDLVLDAELGQGQRDRPDGGTDELQILIRRVTGTGRYPLADAENVEVRYNERPSGGPTVRYTLPFNPEGVLVVDEFNKTKPRFRGNRSWKRTQITQPRRPRISPPTTCTPIMVKATSCRASR